MATMTLVILARAVVSTKQIANNGKGRRRAGGADALDEAANQQLRQRLSGCAAEARDHKQRDTERDDGFATKPVGDGTVEEGRHGEAQHEGTHRQADFRGTHAKRGASRRKCRQIDIDAGVRHGREKAEQ